jgi:hypothetical protein
VLESLDLEPRVTMLDADQWPLGSLDRARTALRTRLRIVPNSAADQKLGAAMDNLLVDCDGRYGSIDRSPLKIAVVRWPGSAT